MQSAAESTARAQRGRSLVNAVAQPAASAVIALPEAMQPDAATSEKLGNAADDALLRPRVSWAVAGKLLHGKAEHVAVPASWREAHAVFWQHPTVVCAAASLLCAACSRLAAPVSWLDGAGAIQKDLNVRRLRPCQQRRHHDLGGRIRRIMCSTATSPRPTLAATLLH